MYTYLYMCRHTYMYICIYICTYVYLSGCVALAGIEESVDSMYQLYIYIYLYIYVYLYIWTRIFIHTYIYIFTCMNMYIYTSGCAEFAGSEEEGDCIYELYIYMYICIYVRIYIYIFIYEYVHLHQGVQHPLDQRRKLTLYMICIYIHMYIFMYVWICIFTSGCAALAGSEAGVKSGLESALVVVPSQQRCHSSGAIATALSQLKGRAVASVASCSDCQSCAPLGGAVARNAETGVKGEWFMIWTNLRLLLFYCCHKSGDVESLEKGGGWEMQLGAFIALVQISESELRLWTTYSKLILCHDVGSVNRSGVF